jgi:hypothetical protein
MNPPSPTGQAMSHADDAGHPAPQSFLTRYVWSQDAKVIAIQYALTAIAVGVVAPGVLQPDAAAARVSGPVRVHHAERYLQLVSMHGMIMVIYLLTALFLGGFGNYLIPLMVGARDMVFPYVNMLSYWLYLLSVVVLMASFFVTGRAHRRGLDAVSTAGHPARHAGPCGRHHPDAGVAGHLRHRLHHGRPELRGDRAAGAHARHDDDAHAAHGVGHLHGHHPGAARVSGPVRQRPDDAAGPDAGHQLLHARAGVEGQQMATRAATRCCSSTCSGSSATPRSTSWRCPPSASCPT